MKETILRKLKDMQKEEQINILYAAESGSRAWGFASKDSDYDCRFIYKKPLAYYLTIRPEIKAISSERGESIDMMIGKDLDIAGWDIFKTLRLLRKSNPPLMEWLFSPIKYIEKGPVAESMRNYIKKRYSNKASSFHYLNMAKGNYKDFLKDTEEVKRKKYLYILRPLACIEWMRSNKTTPPTSFKDVLDGISLDPEVEESIKNLIEEKTAGQELGMGPHDIVLNDYIETALEDFGQWVPKSPENHPDYKELDRILHEEVFRI